MNELEKAYFDKWKKEVSTNRKLNQELEKYKEKEDYLKQMEWKHFKYKKFFEPLACEYKKAYQYLENLNNKFEQLVQLYNKFILLNPNFHVKLSEEDKNKIITEVQLILLDFIKLKKPNEYEIIRDLIIDAKTPKTSKKNLKENILS